VVLQLEEHGKAKLVLTRTRNAEGLMGGCMRRRSSIK